MTSFCKRHTVTAALVMALLSVAGTQAAAQTCPGPTKVIVAYPPGAPDDVIARMLTQKLSASGQTFVIENMPGASGKIGNAAAAKAAADGCTLLIVNSNVAVHAAAGSKVPYDILAGFAPVAFLAAAPETISVHPGVPAKTLQELVNLLKTSPGKYTYASPGFASSPHLAGERLFRVTLGLDVAHVAHQGGPPAVNSTIGGHTNIVHLTLPVVAAAVKDGKLRMLAVADGRRHSMFPDVPTLAEAGIPGHEVGFWNAVLIPRGTPKSVVDELHRSISDIMKSTEMREKLGVMGFTPMAGSPDQLSSHLFAEIGKLKVILEKTGIKIE